MRQRLNSLLLGTLKDNLRDLETLRLVSADELNVLLLREHLRKKIVEIENGNSAENAFEMAA
jgi:hypothetical protein